jgi:hypothetical protein
MIFFGDIIVKILYKGDHRDNNDDDDDDDDGYNNTKCIFYSIIRHTQRANC